jgi:hypothetical protein
MNEIQRLLRQIHRAAGIDPDGPRLVPMRQPQRPEDIRRELRRASDAATRDAMLRRALRFTHSENSP